MNYLDRWKAYLKPWDMIRGAVDETKGDLNAKGKDRHDSFLSGFGKLSDPLVPLLGKGYTHVVHEAIPRYANTAAEPFVRLGHYGNPLYWYGKQTDNEKLNELHQLGENKGADIAGLVTGAIFGGGALLGGAGGGAGGGGAAGGGLGTGTGGTAFNSAEAWGSFGSELGAPFGGSSGGGAGGGGLGSAFSFDWQNPQSYMKLAQAMPQGQGQNNAAALAEAQRQREEEAKRRARERAELLAMIEASQAGSQAGLGAQTLRLYG